MTHSLLEELGRGLSWLLEASFKVAVLTAIASTVVLWRFMPPVSSYAPGVHISAAQARAYHR